MLHSSCSQWNPSFLRVSILACPSHRYQTLMSLLGKRLTRHGVFDCSRSSRIHRFSRGYSKHSLFPLWSLTKLQFHSGQSSIPRQRTVGARHEVTVQTREYWNWKWDLGILKSTDLSCHHFLAVAEIYGDWWTRHVVPSRNSGFPVMWLVAPLCRINLSLKSWLMSSVMWAHAFHGSAEEFTQW